jgi:uncharacterized protein YecE (DUF72 family)
MYDADLKPESYLRAYAQEFRSVEIDSTFYGTPSPERVMKWAAGVPEGFLFSCKVPREITHEMRMVGAAPAIGEFYDAIANFGVKLGCVLFQFDAAFSPEQSRPFWAALEAVPRAVPTAVEFRDPRWYDSGVQRRLADHGIALAVVDAPFVGVERMAEALERSPLDFAYMRLIGDHDAFTRFDSVQAGREREIAFWASRLKHSAPRLKRVFGYVNNHYQGHSPATVRALYAALGVVHARPQRVRQTTLFG